jgi:HSP20 family protein
MFIRFDPFREGERFTGDTSGQQRTRSRFVPIDVFRSGDAYVALLDLPGISPETIDLTVDKQVLTVTAERVDLKVDGAKTFVSERPTGRFTRQLRLGDGLDADGISASYENGVLKVSIPVVEQAKPRRVEISVSSPATVATEVAPEPVAADAA